MKIVITIENIKTVFSKVLYTKRWLEKKSIKKIL